MNLNKRLAKLREERAATVVAREALLQKAETEERGLTDPEKAEFDTADTRQKDLDKEIRQLEDLIAAQKAKIDTRMDPDPKAGKWGDNEVRVRYSARAMAELGGKANEERAFEFGMWTRAMIFGDQRAASWCTDRGMDIRTASESVYSLGGALVPDQFVNFIIDLREQYGLARQLLRVMPMAGDTLTMPRRTGGVTAYFVAENGAFTASDKGWDGVTLTAKKLGALCKLSTELAEDAVIDVAADLAREQAYAFAVKEDDCWLNGDGTSTYGGIWGIRSKIIDGTHTAGAVDAASNHDTFAELDADDLMKVRGTLPIYAERNARWLCSKIAKALVFDALAVASGGNTIMTVGERPRPTYLGDPIEVSQSMPTAQTDISDTAMLLYGDFSLASTMGDRRGFSVQVLRELYAANGQIGVLGIERFDIVNHDLGSNSAAGPVVALIGE